MKETVKELLRSIVISIGMALAIFCIVGIIFDVGNGGELSLENYSFTKMVLGSMIVGLGFGVPTVVYNKDSIPMPIRVVIHMGTGCVIYTVVAYYVGWMGGSQTLLQGILIAAVQLLVAFVIWFCFMRFYRREAKKMNERLQAMKR